MSDKPRITTSSHDAATGSKKTYITGFVLSVSLTAAAFFLVHIHVARHHTYPSDNFMMLALPALAVVQLFVQLVFFLHLSRRSNSRWNAWALAFAAVVVAIVVIGSLWIMSNLNYRMMYSPSQVKQYLKDQSDL
ncbi:MAG TPA: cytochrome o ubiquinol oxidase subunit IV [Candidatus Saccharimonadales bacterium]|nr:cytochrome o ubiquinol oxidase subunit IV [Candidatus Saccharimonadales bacterium]